MPNITGPILDSSGRPANGHLRVRASRPFDIGGGHVTQALGVARVRDGHPYVMDQQWSVPPTPDGVFLILEQDLDGDVVQQFSVSVPDISTLSYSQLLFNRGEGAGGAGPYAWVITSSDPIPELAIIGDIWVESDTGVWGVVNG